jgi:N-acetylglutamate synthase-like GNAT family acetyltransferase
MSDVSIRRATADDQELIRQMVRDENLDPTALNWPNFHIAEHGGQIVGIGQIRPYPRCRELGSLVVKQEYRQQGVGALLVRSLLEQETGDVYLECLHHNETYYARFGFVRLAWWRVPMPLKLKVLLGNLIGRPLMGIRVVAMKYTQPVQ